MTDKEYISNDNGELWEAKKPKKKYTSDDNEIWECDETSEAIKSREALEKLHETMRELRE